jgi:hypothetical protein
MVQNYINNSDKPLETTFCYPVDLNIALSKIEIEFCDLSDPLKKVFIETVIEERKKAENIYNDAVAEGKELAVLSTV